MEVSVTGPYRSRGVIKNIISSYDEKREIGLAQHIMKLWLKAYETKKPIWLADFAWFPVGLFPQLKSRHLLPSIIGL